MFKNKKNMCTKSLVAIAAEVEILINKIEENEDFGPVTLGSKQRLEKLLKDLKIMEDCYNKNPKEIKDLENNIVTYLEKLHNKINKKTIEELKKNLRRSCEELKTFLKENDRKKITNEEAFISNVEMELKKMKDVVNEEEQFEEVEEMVNEVKEMKQSIEDYYYKCIEAVSNVVPYILDFTVLYKGKRYEAPFFTIHSVIEKCIDLLKSIDPKYHRSEIIPFKKKTIEELENARNEFNSKVYENNCYPHVPEEDYIFKVKESLDTIQEMFNSLKDSYKL